MRNFDRRCNAGREANLRDWTIFSDLEVSSSQCEQDEKHKGISKESKEVMVQLKFRVQLFFKATLYLTRSKIS